MTKVIGLTGGIGSGKSTVASFFATKGIPVYIADEEAKKIMNKPNIIQEVQSLFDELVVDENGQLLRSKIASIVFNNPNLLAALNAIIHPKVQEHFQQWLAQNQTVSFVIKEVAILFETGGNKTCDKVILVTAPLETRIERVMKRDQISRNAVLDRIKNQMPDEEKIMLSDFVIHNVDRQTTQKQLNKLLKKLNNL